MPATAVAGSGCGVAGGAVVVDAAVVVGGAPLKVLVTVNVTLLDKLVGESNVTSLPEGPQLALTPSSWQL